MKVRCTECGYDNPNENKVCEKCGTRLNKSELIEPDSLNDNPSQVAKTMIGQSGDNLIPWDENLGNDLDSLDTKSNFIACDQCNYQIPKSKLKIVKNCPNCNAVFSHGVKKAEEPVGSDNVKSRKDKEVSESTTLRLDHMIASEEETNNKYFLVNDLDQSKIELKKGENILNREILDKENRGISSRKHAAIQIEENKVVLTDQSSNSATFVQVVKPIELKNDQKVILGNKYFTLLIE